MDKIKRPLNHSYKRDWYWDHDKRLEDALVAQFGIEDEGYHPDGIHRNDRDTWPRGK